MFGDSSSCDVACVCSEACVEKVLQCDERAKPIGPAAHASRLLYTSHTVRGQLQ